MINQKMKNYIPHALTIFILLLIPGLSYGQSPDLGAAANFVLFTSTGAFGNTGTSLVSGDIGSNSASVTGFPPGTITGIIYDPPDATLAQAAIDAGEAYSYLAGKTCDAVIGTLLEGQVLTAGVYCTGAATSLNGDITLDGQGDPNALFIIQIDGALTVGEYSISTVTLINSASLCNVYWQINGQFDLGAGSTFSGTLIVNGAIFLYNASSLFGRGLSIDGAVAINNAVVRFIPEAAGTITGTTPVCQGETGVGYTVPAIADAETYNWTLPVGASIASGANTNSITVDYSNTAISGDITVSGNNSCGGDGAAGTLAITVHSLPATSAIYHE
jgi:hypothetical protein